MPETGDRVQEGAGEGIEEECLAVLFCVSHDGFESIRAGAPRTHKNHGAFQMACPDSEPFREAEHEFKVRRATDGGNKGTVLFKTLPFAVESGVSRAPAFPEGAGGVFLSSPGADNFPFPVDVVQISVNGVCFRMIAEGPRDILQDMVVLVVVIGIEESDDIACCHAEALVHGIVNSLVRFGYPTHAPGKVLFMSTDQFDGSIGAAAVDDDIFVVVIALLQDALHGIRQRIFAVAADCDDGDFHGINFLGVCPCLLSVSDHCSGYHGSRRLSEEYLVDRRGGHLNIA